MLGSLDEFINPGQLSFSTQEEVPLTTRISRKHTLEERRKKSRVRQSEYIPSDKKCIFVKKLNSFSDQLQNLPSSEPERNYITGRKALSESPMASMFHGSNIVKHPDDPAQKLKREHNLLRAIARTKLSETQKIKVSEFEESFQRMVQDLGKVKLKPVVEYPRIAGDSEVKTHRSIQINNERQNRNRISHRKRIEFQNCLSWSKKHNKDGSFYASQLGKNIVHQDKNFSLKKRKKILEQIHQRSRSVVLDCAQTH